MSTFESFEQQFDGADKSDLLAGMLNDKIESDPELTAWMKQCLAISAQTLSLLAGAFFAAAEFEPNFILTLREVGEMIAADAEEFAERSKTGLAPTREQTEKFEHPIWKMLREGTK